MSRPGFLIAAPQSGSGKTTVSLAIMAALSRRGLAVAPFKCGPDFIDPGYHQAVTGRASINLDGWMCPADFVRATFDLHSAGADVAVIEGVMGLFDGIGASCKEGSSAQIAAITGAPVVLVVNARGMAASAAALIKGFVDFDPQVRLAGVIFNNVGSDAHAGLLRQSLAAALPAVTVFGCIPRDESLAISSRHLGLVTADDNPLSRAFVDRLAQMAESCLDLAGLIELQIPPGPPFTKGGVNSPPFTKGGQGGICIAVARDAAFCFCYPDNLRLLREAGAEIVFFSPLADRGLPPGCAGIYLPGGYPELHTQRLAANGALQAAIIAAIHADMPVYAECGGLIYLSEGVADAGAFVGVFPVRARMLAQRKALGYRQVEACAGSLIGPAGTVARGHEFHYSEIGTLPAAIERIYRVTRQGRELAAEGYRYRSCLASYIHLHFGSNPLIAPAFVAACKAYRAMSGAGSLS
ncbi:MAG: cobyrinate a,c-diamide synthase [Geobacteraceae bacterium]|nr:cobyrinate a,c-diamide synthase [Geobacteraceae bacterium]